MTPIPDDHHAAKDLQRQFAELGHRHVRARRSTPAGTRRTLVTTAAVLGVLAAGAGATKIFIVDAGDVPHSRDNPSDIKRSPGDARLSRARFPDPYGGPPWGARTYVSRDGADCVVIGRVFRGGLGVLRGTQFKALPPDAPGTCKSADAGNEPLIARRVDYATARRVKTIVFGLAGRDIRSLAVSVGGRTLPTPIAQDGVFLLVRPGEATPATVRWEGSEGSGSKRLP